LLSIWTSGLCLVRSSCHREIRAYGLWHSYLQSFGYCSVRAQDGSSRRKPQPNRNHLNPIEQLSPNTKTTAQSGDLTDRHFPARVGKLAAILLCVPSSSPARLAAPAEPKIPNHGKLRFLEKASGQSRFHEKGGSDEEIWKCPQEFKQPAVVPAKWNDRGWSSHNGVWAYAQQFGCV